MRYSNPIIPGCYPDPSICRAGDDYYLVTSSFTYFPGVPIFHSRDLIHWQQIGHCLTRPSQLPLAHAESYAGIYAPTIRYHAGLFYMITTNVSVGKHFYVTTDNPAGDWSESIWLDQEGIDPSLCFDEGGKVYFTFTKQGGIYQSEIDIQTGQNLTQPRLIWSGTGGRYPEAPHLYRIKGRYYLMIAEGGTEYGHMETIARSDSPWGPFEACPHNPILTHRNFGGNLIQGTGHGDLIETADGQWWMVFLAFRQARIYQQYHHLGRETFLAPVTWDDDGWPVVYHNAPIEQEMNAEGLPPTSESELMDDEIDDFESPTLKPYWNFLRNPNSEDWSLTERPGCLRLKGNAFTLNDLDSPAFVGRRQQHFGCSATVALDFNPQQDGDEAGLVVFMNETHHYEIAVIRLNDARCVIVRRRIGDLIAIVAQEPLAEGIVRLAIRAESEIYHFLYAQDDLPLFQLASGAAKYLSSEVAGGFTGVYLGMYASGRGQPASAPADFDWFEYQPHPST